VRSRKRQDDETPHQSHQQTKKNTEPVFPGPGNFQTVSCLRFLFAKGGGEMIWTLKKFAGAALIPPLPRMPHHSGTGHSPSLGRQQPNMGNRKRLARRLRLTMTDQWRCIHRFEEKGHPLPHEMQMAPLRKGPFHLQVWKASNGRRLSSWLEDCMQVPGHLVRLNFPRTTFCYI
jgi:hypothetical protein